MVVRPAPPRKVMKTPLVLPAQIQTSLENRRSRRGRGQATPIDAASMAGNEVIVEVVGTGEEIGKFDIKAGDRLAIANVLCPIVVDCKQFLLIHVHDVLAKINNWQPEDKVKPVL